MRSYVQTYPTQIFVHELLMPEVTGIQVQNVVVYLARLFDILLVNAVLNDVCDVVGQVLFKSCQVLIVHEVPLEGAH